jgi:hypothetical protein
MIRPHGEIGGEAQGPRLMVVGGEWSDQARIDALDVVAGLHKAGNAASYIDIRGERNITEIITALNPDALIIANGARNIRRAVANYVGPVSMYAAGRAQDIIEAATAPGTTNSHLRLIALSHELPTLPVRTWHSLTSMGVVELEGDYARLDDFLLQDLSQRQEE